ncbi:atherin-like isoform X2 [Carcharodon carcharias]|uniref:atherin-like isoform X2 n=1 Tax=Carcharodon carcharias TaxID=13397 RepID=UPI001B7DFD65|nr:atherin-like isoform X2 [Carcharodon carcharias]
MSEAECKQWILDTIDSLRCRKARPDLERICKMVQRRHGLAPSRTRRQLERLLKSRTVLRVSYKGSHSYRNAAKWQAGQAEPEPEREREEPQPQPQPRTVLTRARLRGVREQQVSRAGSRKQRPAERSSPASRRRIPEPGTGTERKKTRRSKGADPSGDEGSDEEAPPEDQESASQTLREARNGVESVADCVSEDCDTEESPIKPPATEGRPTEDVVEELPTDKQVEASSAVKHSPSPCCSVDAEMKLDVEALKTVQERLSPDNAGNVGSSEKSTPMEEGCSEECSQEPCANQDTSLLKDCNPSNADSFLDTMLLGQIPAANPSPKLEAVETAAGLSSDPRDLVPEVGGASCLLTPSASPIDMVPEENGPTDRHLLEENGKSVDPTEWSIADVVNYFKEAGFPEQASAFEDQEIDGKSLLLMKRNDVLTGLAIKLGPALKIYEYHIKVLQLHHFNNEAPSC